MLKTVALTLAMACVLVVSAAFAADKEFKVGFVYVSPVGEAGWSHAHDQGRKALDGTPGVTTAFQEAVPEGPDAERVLTAMARKGFDMIVAASYGYMDSVNKVAKQFPKTIFMHCSGFKRESPNVGTYFGRIYQARYLAGLTAGAMTKSKTIGYVAAFPIPEVIRGVNAFALGVQAVNPEAQVRVVWTKTWYDPATEKEAAKSLLDVGADVIAMHQDSPGPMEAAQERGAWAIGYNSDMSRFAPKAHLTAPVWNWGVLYKKLVEKARAGQWQSEDLWWGMETGIVDLAPFGPMVPEAVRAKVNQAKQDIIGGKLTVFAGPVLDQSGRQRAAPGAVIPDQELRGMTWFVKGVIGSAE